MSALPANVTPSTWVIDPAHSEAAFTVRHAGISKVRGTVAIIDGTITVGDSPETSSVTATLDATKVTTGDAARDGHLTSADFFDVDKYPTWTFTSTQVTPTSADEFDLAGQLTIHGVTLPVTLEVEMGGVAHDPMGNTRAGFSASLEISRKDFGLTWNAAMEAGGLLVSDKVKIQLEISAILQG